MQSESLILYVATDSGHNFVSGRNGVLGVADEPTVLAQIERKRAVGA